MFTPSIKYQGFLLFLFGLIYLIINIFIAVEINDNCTLADSEDNLIRHLLTITNVLSSILIFFGFIGMLSHKYPKITEYFGFMWFYKYGNFFPTIGFLVCSSYLLSIVNNLNCTDDKANSYIQKLSIGTLVMSIIYFIISCFLFYYLHQDTDEDIKAKAEKTFSEVSKYSENNIDIKLNDTYESSIKDLEKSLSLVDRDTDIKYSEKITLLNKYIKIAKLRDDAKQIYKKIQGKTLDYQVTEINTLVCNNKNIPEDEKAEMIKELNNLNKKLPTECKNAPPEYSAKTEAAKVKEQADAAKEELELEKARQALKALRNPIKEVKEEVKDEHQLAIELGRIREEKARRDAEIVNSQLKTLSIEMDTKKKINQLRAAQAEQAAQAAQKLTVSVNSPAGSTVNSPTGSVNSEDYSQNYSQDISFG